MISLPMELLFKSKIVLYIMYRDGNNIFKILIFNIKKLFNKLNYQK